MGTILIAFSFEIIPMSLTSAKMLPDTEYLFPRRSAGSASGEARLCQE